MISDHTKGTIVFYATSAATGAIVIGVIASLVYMGLKFMLRFAG